MTQNDLPPTVREKLSGPARPLFEYLLSADSYTTREVAERFKHVPLGHNGPVEFFVDRSIQLLRRNGLVRFRRQRNSVVWSPTKRIDLSEPQEAS